MGRRSLGLAMAFGLLRALAAPIAHADAPPNLIVVVLDDIGIDRVGAFGSATSGPTPHIDALAAQGVRFDRFWAQPVCSPFRASALTGLEPWQHGVGSVIFPDGEARAIGLDPNADTIAKRLRAAGYRTEAIGKWHLAGDPVPTGLHPLLSGFDHHRGTLGNPADSGGNYSRYVKCRDGSCWMREHRPYLTTDTTNDAIDVLYGSEPFFLWLAFNAAHVPLHVPPPYLHSFAVSNCFATPATKVECSKAITEAVDRELGRFLTYVDWSTTTVIVVSDNGTSANVLEPPDPDRGKATLYESGIHTPLIVRGSAVAPGAVGGVSHALVQASDLFATVLELAGLGDAPPSSISFAAQLVDPAAPSARTHAFAETFTPNGGPPDPSRKHGRAVRDDRYKLIEWAQDDERRIEMYDLGGSAPDVDETNDLLAGGPLDASESAALATLTRALATTGALPVPSATLASPSGAAGAAALLALGSALATARRERARRARRRARD
ncbi:MAG: sulfatase-like hydrolase/transferase [Myxococcota bacterium]